MVKELLQSWDAAGAVTDGGINCLIVFINNWKKASTLKHSWTRGFFFFFLHLNVLGGSKAVLCAIFSLLIIKIKLVYFSLEKIEIPRKTYKQIRFPPPPVDLMHRWLVEYYEEHLGRYHREGNIVGYFASKNAINIKQAG
ncbi:hypothetical protein ACJX0J_008021 [Zea mays]